MVHIVSVMIYIVVTPMLVGSVALIVSLVMIALVFRVGQGKTPIVDWCLFCLLFVDCGGEVYVLVCYRVLF